MTSFIQNIEFYNNFENKGFKMNSSKVLNLEKMNFNRCNPIIGVMNPITTSSKSKEGDKKDN